MLELLILVALCAIGGTWLFFGNGIFRRFGSFKRSRRTFCETHYGRIYLESTDWYPSMAIEPWKDNVRTVSVAFLAPAGNLRNFYDFLCMIFAEKIMRSWAADLRGRRMRLPDAMIMIPPESKVWLCAEFNLHAYEDFKAILAEKKIEFERLPEWDYRERPLPLHLLRPQTLPD